MKILRLLAPFLTLAFSLTAWADDRAGVREDHRGSQLFGETPSVVLRGPWPGERAKLTGIPMLLRLAGRMHRRRTIQFPSRRAAVVSATQTQFGSIFLSLHLGNKDEKCARWRITEIVAPQ